MVFVFVLVYSLIQLFLTPIKPLIKNIMGVLLIKNRGRVFCHGAMGLRIDLLWWTFCAIVLSCLWDGAYKTSLAPDWKQ